MTLHSFRMSYDQIFFALKYIEKYTLSIKNIQLDPSILGDMKGVKSRSLI
jgi:hypothetical protein